MITCAVIGANGFLGKEISKKLVASGYKVYCVYNTNKSSLCDSTINISTEEFLHLNVNFDFIYFSVGSFTSTYSTLIYLHCQLLLQIISKFPNTKLIYISSTNVYGTNTDILEEQSCFHSPADYGKAKLAGEFVAATAKRYAILRLTYLYGAGLNNGSFLPKIIEEARDKKCITLFGKGERSQDYLHVDDATDLCLRLISYDTNGVFLGATGISITNEYIAKQICLEIKPCVINYVGNEIGVSFYFNPRSTFERLNWKPNILFEEGIKSMII